MGRETFSFAKADVYSFLFESTHLVLVSWTRDDTKMLFLVAGQDEDGMMLDYPGEMFSNRVLDAVERIFFVQVNEDGKDPERYVLGSFFEVDGSNYAAYLQRDVESPQVVLFRADGEAPDFSLEIIEGTEYERVSLAFAEQHQDILDLA